MASASCNIVEQASLSMRGEEVVDGLSVSSMYLKTSERIRTLNEHHVAAIQKTYMTTFGNGCDLHFVVAIPESVEKEQRNRAFHELRKRNVAGAMKYIDHFEVIDGNHRLRALENAKITCSVTCSIYYVLDDERVSAIETLGSSGKATYLPVGLIDKIIATKDLVEKNKLDALKVTQVDGRDYGTAITCGMTHFSLTRLRGELRPLFHLFETVHCSKADQYVNILGSWTAFRKAFPLYNHRAFKQLCYAFGDEKIQRQNHRNAEFVKESSDLLMKWKQAIEDHPDTLTMAIFAEQIEKDKSAKRIYDWLKQGASLTEDHLPNWTLSMTVSSGDAKENRTLKRSHSPPEHDTEDSAIDVVQKKKVRVTKKLLKVEPPKDDADEAEWLEFRKRIRDERKKGTKSLELVL